LEKENYTELMELLNVIAVYKTSSKSGKNVKIAIASLVREILKESSFINRVDSSGDQIATA
jgi:hypothetical protein